MSVLVEFSMFPLGAGSSSLSAAVAPIVALVRESGLNYRLTAMGTLFEAERLADALALIERAHRLLNELGFERIYTVIKMDSRRSGVGRLDRKVEAVAERIGEIAT
jgi:uncharacterized protein (TIGR00106 family)